MKRILQGTPNAKTVVGIAGVSPGVGTTHFTITLANYAAEKWRRKVAVLGWKGRGEYRSLCVEAKKESFRLLGVDYFLEVDETRIVSILNMGYDYYLIDFGCGEGMAWEELLRCDRKIVIGSCSVWRQQEFLDFWNTITNQQLLCTRWDVLAISGMLSDKKELEVKMKQKIRFIPYLEDPFQTERKYFNFLEQFL